jgi:hypothetical protein
MAKRSIDETRQPTVHKVNALGLSMSSLLCAVWKKCGQWSHACLVKWQFNRLVNLSKSKHLENLQELRHTEETIRLRISCWQLDSKSKSSELCLDHYDRTGYCSNNVWELSETTGHEYSSWVDQCQTRRYFRRRNCNPLCGPTDRDGFMFQLLAMLNRIMNLRGFNWWSICWWHCLTKAPSLYMSRQDQRNIS